MPRAQDLFTELLDQHIWPPMKAEGLLRRASTFWLRGDGTWGVINFQGSRYNTAEEVRFTVNVSVASERLRRTYGWKEGARPSEADCQIRERLGFHLPDRPPRDYWWIVDRNTDLGRLGRDLVEYLRGFALPFLRQFPDDANLRDFWLRQLDEREIADHHVRFLADLVEQIGPLELRARIAEAQSSLDSPAHRAELEAERAKLHAKLDALPPFTPETVDWDAIEEGRIRTPKPRGLRRLLR